MSWRLKLQCLAVCGVKASWFVVADLLGYAVSCKAHTYVVRVLRRLHSRGDAGFLLGIGHWLVYRHGLRCVYLYDAIARVHGNGLC